MRGGLDWLSRRYSPRFLGLSRVLAWGAGYGAVLVVAYAYPGLPDELWLSRWTVAHKSMFFALRVPLIHLAAIGLCEILARILSRAPAEHRQLTECAGAALLSTAGIKALLAGVAIVSPEPRPSNSALSLLAVGMGLALAGWFAQPFIASGGLRASSATRLERGLGAALLLTIVLLNLPLVAPTLVPSALR